MTDMDAISLGYQGLRMHKYAKLSPSTITMFGNDLDVNKTWLPLMDEFTIDYHGCIRGFIGASDGWTWYRLTAALRELSRGESTGEVANYTRGYGDACHHYGTTNILSYPQPANAYERGWNTALQDLAELKTP